MMVVAAAGQAGCRGAHWRGALRIGVYLPLTTVNIMVLDALSAVSSGGACIVMDRSDAGGVAEWIERERVHAMSSAPATIFDLIDREDIEPRQLASLKFISCGGAMISDELMARFKRKFGAPMYPAYGLTEAPTAIAGHMSDKPCAPGSCGIVYEHLEVAVLDGEGRELPLGEPGEVCVRATTSGPWAGVYTPMLGYWRRPEESAESLRHGWLHTGDVATMDAAGNVFLKDRLKDLIIKGGSNVYPAEIERVIKLDPRVRDAAVLGKPDERLGERVVAFVELVEPGKADAAIEDELKALCRGELAKYKLPDAWIFPAQMPRNAMNKIVKAELRAAFLS
jgi:long-chain acyl-CoA synthetase